MYSWLVWRRADLDTIIGGGDRDVLKYSRKLKSCLKLCLFTCTLYRFNFETNNIACTILNIENGSLVRYESVIRRHAWNLLP